MKKILSLMAATLLATGAFAQAPSNAVGLYRTMSQNDGDWIASEQLTTTVDGITVTRIYGSTTESTDLDNDANYEGSTECARWHGTLLPADGLGDGRIFPMTELAKLDENSYVGFKMTIPEDKSFSINKLVASGLFGNAYNWTVTISQNGTELYSTGKLKINGYDKNYCYIDSINVTATAATGLSDAAKERTKVPAENTEEAVMGWSGWTAGNYLPATLQNLTGEVEVKFYYWNKVKKVMAIKDLYVSSDATTGISVVTANAENENAPMYNLAGQRVSKNAKGIVIQNGKKMILK